jgi:hypothetical protein
MANKSREAIEYTMEGAKAHLLIAGIIVLVSTIIIPFIWIYGYGNFRIGWGIFSKFFLVWLIGGIVIHELLHGLTLAYFVRNRFKSIKFGIDWKNLSPYCHCNEPLKVTHYKLGVAMPLIVMGIIPMLTGFIIGNGAIFIIGIFFTWAASGDIIILFMLRNLKNDDCVLDHPKKLGFILHPVMGNPNPQCNYLENEVDQ